MPKTIDEIFAEYFSRQDAIRAEHDSRMARLQAARDAMPAVTVQPTIIDGWYTPEQYSADSAAGRNTD